MTDTPLFKLLSKHSFDFRHPHAERIYAAGINPAGLNLRTEELEEKDEPNDKETQVEKHEGGRMEGVHGVPARLHSCWNGSHRGLVIDSDCTGHDCRNLNVTRLTEASTTSEIKLIRLRSLCLRGRDAVLSVCPSVAVTITPGLSL